MRSEFAPTSSTHNPSHHPSLSDITIHSTDSLIFTLRRSKTDQLGISCPIYIFRLNSDLSHTSRSPNTSTPGMPPRHHLNTLSSSPKQEKWPPGSGFRSTYTASLISSNRPGPRPLVIPGISVLHTQQSQRSPSSSHPAQLNLNPTLLGA